VGLTVPDPVPFVKDPVYMISLGLIGFLAVVMITVEASLAAFSLHLAHWIFVYIFFFAAPVAQYKIGMFPWRKLTSLETDTLLFANLAILLWCVTWIFFRVVQMPIVYRLRLPAGPRITTPGVWITVLLASCATVYLVLKSGLGGLLTRAEDYRASLEISSLDLMLDRLSHGLPAAASAGALWYLHRGSSPLVLRLGLLVLSLGLLLIADFPLGSARYLVGSIYIGLLLILLGRYLRTGWPLTFFLIGGLLVAFPMLSTLRYVTSPSEVPLYLSGFNFLGSSLATGDFDAYSMVGYTVKYVNEGPGITYGQQLLGVLLFFIPRSLWPGKPVGSGYTIASDGGLIFNNVSSPPVAEGLINFGWVGVILFAVALCWLFGLLDAGFERARREGDTFVAYVYPFLIGFVFFLMRGDLLSATAFILGFTAAFLPLTVRLPKSIARSLVR
jgi:hypothetical protein